MTRALHLAYPPAEGAKSAVDTRLLPPGQYAYPTTESGAGDGLIGLSHMQDLATHVARFGPRPSAVGAAGDVLLGLLEEAGLAGHGGGHFPVARKWRTVLRNGGGGIVVANGAESEPASAKDRALMATVPHLILDGLALAAEVLGAQAAVVWMHEDTLDAGRAIAAAAAERRAHGLAEIGFQRVMTPPSYLSGESSAILRSLSGGPTLPAFSRQPAAVAGFRGRPALVQNVETLARIGLLARTGMRSHRPTALVTVNRGNVRTVLEVDERTTIGQATAAAGWKGSPPQAVLVGGYGGAWLPWALAANAPMRHRELAALGAGMGAGVLIPVGASECGIARTARISAFLSDAGARQCGPCRFGLPALTEGIAALAAGRAHRHQVARLNDLAGLVDGRGGCHHPDGAARLITSALRTFAEDAAGHARGLPCTAARASLVGVG
jgi:NADH:ubiquinone oxidoreductase subunit F (NADH-binding)